MAGKEVNGVEVAQFGREDAHMTVVNEFPFLARQGASGGAVNDLPVQGEVNLGVGGELFSEVALHNVDDEATLPQCRGTRRLQVLVNCRMRVG